MTPDTSDALVFAAESTLGEKTPGAARNDNAPWKVIIVDDDESIHEVTKMVLAGFTFAERELQFISAYSGAEAKRVLAEHPDASVVLLDVVMEDDHAGLEVARSIRDDLNNKLVRIILRTGQPGQAPERRVIVDYDINDYKEKTELTANKLYTVIYASLRSYRDMVTIESNRRGLEKIIDSSTNIFELQSMSSFTAGVLEQMTGLLHLDEAAVYCHGLAASHQGETFEILAGTGGFADCVGQDACKALSEDIVADLREALRIGGNLYRDDHFVGFFKTKTGAEKLVYLKGIKALDETDRNLIELFTRNVSIAHENITLHQDLEETQREIVYMLGEAVETRSKETGNHVKRVAEISKLLAVEYGLDADHSEIIKLASPLHDIGKIGIPDAILNKPGRHTDEESEIMRTHARMGYDMLKASKRRILRAGAIIANEHHEKWNGTGYPHGKKGEDIHIYGRIAALADVFDALGSDRCYKKAWPLGDILDLLGEERGAHFDPALVDILLTNIDKVTAIGDQYSDELVAAA